MMRTLTENEMQCVAGGDQPIMRRNGPIPITLPTITVTAPGGYTGAAIMTGIGAGTSLVAIGTGVFWSGYVGWRAGRYISNNYLNPATKRAIGGTVAGMVNEVDDAYNWAKNIFRR